MGDVVVKAFAISPGGMNATRARGPRAAVVANGLPIPIVGGLFTPPVLAVMYVFVAIRFWLGYHRTTFDARRNKAMMVALWPVLAVASAEFRKNLKKATL